MTARSADRADVEIAFEHVAWCAREGLSPQEVLLSLGAPVPSHPTWMHVAAAVLMAQRCMSGAARRREDAA